ncbi:GNAT family N-acetyltransferase [Jannaschia ovalis]|uniref:N-acetyltransferase n=1 Tax=Jannaschia ovalis TaxID=3038773 RepID=A0ABY8LFH1_9RHOB|nr:N-acetyltransferase [Jannaschia sp. GRR-S6-38]WGH80049.1 N-acetyltransferase [Jannaschia sp. GRR-S6-38]
MSAPALARLHARCFTGAARWSEAAFAEALADPRCFFCPEGGDGTGFALGRVIAGEAELLTLAVAPERRRQGTGRALLQGFEAEAMRRAATDAFLEVAADNVAARGLYAAQGWIETGRRRGYFAGIDALTLHKVLHAAP